MLDSFRNTFGETMTAWEKSVQKRPYRERGQIKRREKLGLLEKHKDYVKRAKNYQTKQKVWENGPAWRRKLVILALNSLFSPLSL